MKKNKVKALLILLIILIILIVCLNVGVYAAYVLSATEVNYIKSDGTEVSVKSALDELYAKNVLTVKRIYNYSASLPSDDNANYSGSYFTVNVKSLYPSTYTTYTSSNFYFITTTVYAFADNDNSSQFTPGISPTWSYNASTGILTVSNLGCSVGGVDDVEVKITGGYVILIE